MSIEQITTANTFAEWLARTQALIEKWNLVEDTANSVYSKSNNINVMSSLVFNTSNTVNTKINVVDNVAELVFSTSNSVNSKLIMVNDTANLASNISNTINNSSNLMIILASNLSSSLNNTSNLTISLISNISNNINTRSNTVNTTSNTINNTANLVSSIANSINDISIINDITTNSNNFNILFSANTSGKVGNVKVSSTKLGYNPSSGLLFSQNFQGDISRCYGYSTPGVTKYQGYKAIAVGINNLNVVVTCDSVDLVNSSGFAFNTRNVYLNINAAGTIGYPLSIMQARAASTFYYVWLWRSATVNNGNVTATLDSSYTNPTTPSGYSANDFKALMPGAFLTDNSGTKYLMQMATVGDTTTYRPLTGSNTPIYPSFFTGGKGSPYGTSINWGAVYWPTYAPPIQKELLLVFGAKNTPNYTGYLAPSTNFGSATSSNPPPVVIFQSDFTYDGAVARITSFFTESDNIYAAASFYCYLSIMGWRNNI